MYPKAGAGRRSAGEKFPAEKTEKWCPIGSLTSILIEPSHPDGQGRRPPYLLATMPRIHIKRKQSAAERFRLIHHCKAASMFSLLCWCGGAPEWLLIWSRRQEATGGQGPNAVLTS